ncbi:MAG: hotdog fold thioesterase [Chitinophagales bacterium]
MIWQKEFTIEEVNAGRNNMVLHLGIEFTEKHDKYVIAKMPVDERTRQPFGILHGGASVALAETLGSMAGWLCLSDEKMVVVGQEINANHLRSVREGYVYGKAFPIHLGRKSQVWAIEITNEEGKMVCISRMTLAVVPIV